MLLYSTFRFPSLPGLLIYSLLVLVSALFEKEDTNQHGEGVPSFHFDAYVAGADTTRPTPIEERPCVAYDWFDAPEDGWKSLSSSPLPGTHYASLHELTCKWAAYQNGLSLDSTRLPKYVQPTGDTLRLNGHPFAYGVKMRPVDPDRIDKSNLYLVADVADSLFYREIGNAYPFQQDDPSTVSIRAVRPIEVPGAESQYLWVEIEERHLDAKGSPTGTYTRWRGHIFAYDRRRGMRYLHRAPVRVERMRGGKLVGAEQWDVSVPEPGIMLVEPRLKRGKVGEHTIEEGGVTLGPPQHWIGRHVIDPTATSKREVEMTPGSNYTKIIDTTEVENWREVYGEQ